MDLKYKQLNDQENIYKTGWFFFFFSFRKQVFKSYFTMSFFRPAPFHLHAFYFSFCIFNFFFSVTHISCKFFYLGLCFPKSWETKRVRLVFSLCLSSKIMWSYMYTNKRKTLINYFSFILLVWFFHYTEMHKGQIIN